MKMREHDKCEDCLIMDRMRDCEDACCCVWYMDNVVLDNKTVDECTAFIPMNKEKPNDQI